jgi:hypothetical protein
MPKTLTTENVEEWRQVVVDLGRAFQRIEQEGAVGNHICHQLHEHLVDLYKSMMLPKETEDETDAAIEQAVDK